MRRIFLLFIIFYLISCSIAFAQSGCCSWHGGIAYCGSNGYYICNDGTQSPTCTCYNPIFYHNYTIEISNFNPENGKITSFPPGIDCGNDCEESFIPGTTVTLYANAKMNSFFNMWLEGPFVSGCTEKYKNMCKIVLPGSLPVSFLDSRRDIGASFSSSITNRNCYAVLSNDLSLLQIPIIDYENGSEYFWANFSIETGGENIMLKLIEFGFVNDSEYKDCDHSSLSNENFILHVPLIKYFDIYFSADFEYYPTTGEEILFKFENASFN